MIGEYEKEINLLDLLKEIKRKVAIILLIGIIFGGVFYIYSYVSEEETYMAEATLYIETKTAEGMIPERKESIPADYIELIKSKEVLESVIDRTNIELSYEQLLSMLMVTNTEGTYVLNIKINSKTADEAAVLANEVALKAVEMLDDVSDIYKLKIIGEASVPTSPVISNKTEDTIIVALMGCFVALAVIVLHFIFRNAISSREDAEIYLKAKVIGEYIAKKDKDCHYKRNVFKFLCSNINNIAGTARCILVMGTAVKDNSEDICCGMIQSLRSAGKTAVLINMGFDHVKEDNNYSEYKNSVLKLKEENDFIIISSSYLEHSADILDLMDCCDGAILVVEKNRTNRKTARYAKEQLEFMKCNLLGIVIIEK